jgi:hypothetical protein
MTNFDYNAVMIDLVLFISCCTGDICHHDGVPVDVSVNERAASSVVPVVRLVVKDSQELGSVCHLLEEVEVEEYRALTFTRHVPSSLFGKIGKENRECEEERERSADRRMARGFGNGITVRP